MRVDQPQKTGSEQAGAFFDITVVFLILVN